MVRCALGLDGGSSVGAGDGETEGDDEGEADGEGAGDGDMEADGDVAAEGEAVSTVSAIEFFGEGAGSGLQPPRRARDASPMTSLGPTGWLPIACRLPVPGRGSLPRANGRWDVPFRRRVAGPRSRDLPPAGSYGSPSAGTSDAWQTF